ncbi:hypothetical protein [Caballeronia glebae]|nr:hypothetical protein [Caballeronia glebae]
MRRKTSVPRGNDFRERRSRHFAGIVAALNSKIVRYPNIIDVK